MYALKVFSISYRGKLRQGETLANDHKFAKVSPAKFYACIEFVEQMLSKC